MDGGAPYYAVYETTDGRYVSIGAMEHKFYELLLSKLDLADDMSMWHRPVPFFDEHFAFEYRIHTVKANNLTDAG